MVIGGKDSCQGGNTGSTEQVVMLVLSGGVGKNGGIGGVGVTGSIKVKLEPR